MTTAVRRRRGTTAQHATFTGLEGEISIDTTKDTVVVHDGTTAGGHPLAKENNTALTGNVTVTTNSTSPALTITQDGTGNALEVRDVTGDTTPFMVDASGNVGIGGTAPAGVRLQVSDSTSNAAQFRVLETGSSVDVRLVSMGTGALAGVVGTYSNHPLVLYSNGTDRLRINPAGLITANNSTGLGYGAGSGGTVTQATSKSTAVTLNKPSGQITMHNAALAAGATVAFVMNNSTISGYDTLSINTIGGGDTANYSWNVQTAGGFAAIYVTNRSGGSLSDALVFQFNVIKGTTS